LIDMFSPLAFPSGTLIYYLSTSFPLASHLVLSPFEQFREPLVIIGIADASEYEWLTSTSRDGDEGQNGPFDEPDQEDEASNDLRTSVGDLREQFPRAYSHTLMMFDSTAQFRHPYLPQETILIPPKAQLKTTTIKTCMCDLTATLLAEMTTLAKSIQALPTVPSPSSSSGASETPSWADADSAVAQFARRGSQALSSSRPESPGPNSQKDLHRMSMPVLPSTTGGPLTLEDPRAASPSTQGTRTPPTTFDEISGINAANTLHQTNSNSPKAAPASTKDSASDRVSIHGFGSGGVGERARNKGRGRVSIVIGTLYMCAGQWHEAIRELIEGATRARAFSDHLWHAKALENIMVCLLLFAWSGMEFQVSHNKACCDLTY
jgi:trafficking protein particle complex subunit 9